MVRNKRIVVVFFIGIFTIIMLSGCGKSKSIQDEKKSITDMITTNASTTESIDENGNQVAITAGKTKIYIDEVRYYAYKTQATYEVYYLSKDKTLDWNRELSEGVTLEEGVKSEVLDGLCRRLALFESADKYNVSLTKEQKAEVIENVEYYFANSSEKMISKVNISKDRLEKIYEKEMIADLVEKAMEAKEQGSADAMYTKWKEDNKVVTGKEWDAINFDDRIMQ